MLKPNIILVLKLTVLVLSISYLVDKVIFYSLNTLSDNVMTGQSIGKLNQFLTVKDSVDCVVLGNSRANHHIDVSLLNTSAYNMGIDGTGIAYISALTHSLDKQHNQLVLVHIDTKDFFDLNYNGSDIKTLSAKFNRDKNITASLKQSGLISPLQYFYYTINYNNKLTGILKNYFQPSYNYQMYNGFDPLILSEDQQKIRDEILLKQENEECSQLTTINPIALNYLEHIKEDAEQENKTYIFITSPIYNDTCPEDNLKLKKLLTEAGLTYWDFSNLFKDLNDTSLWKDETHMSAFGAEQFTLHLKQKLESISY
ncbi:hypothetical protein [Formosa sp. A9]|uniref:hypothetical protein n=1 Tax=Formosa sp. A9 TaxID=3442641 RepID=UPI003EBB3827